jgi:putative aldouronate transport system substrate-binding protein
MIMLMTQFVGCTQKTDNTTSDTTNNTTNVTTNVSTGGDKKLEEVKLVLMGISESTSTRTEAILEKINEITKREINATIEVQNIPQESYNITLTAIEGVDIIISADYLSYYDNSRKSAYLPIDLEDIKKYCPTWYADNADKLPSATVGSKIYALPQSNPSYNAPSMMLRKDLMDKYGIKEVKNFVDLDNYFAAIKKNEPGMTPFALDTGLTSWLTGAYAFGATGLMAPGGPNCTSVVCFKKGDDPNYKMYRTWEQPELAKFLKTMKDFKNKGYWTQDVLANPVPLNQAFRAGTTSVAWATGMPEPVNSTYSEMKVLLPEAQIYVFEVGSADNIPIDTYSPMGGATSFPRNSKNYERSLMLAELLYTNEELTRLFKYGILNEDYTLNDKGEAKVLDPENGFNFYTAMTSHTKFDFPPEGGNYPGYDQLKDSLKAREQQNPFVGFGLDTTNISDIAANMWTIHMEYGMPIYLGLVDDVDAAIAELNKQYEKAGIETYEQEVLKQLQAFIKANGLTQTVELGK